MNKRMIFLIVLITVTFYSFAGKQIYFKSMFDRYKDINKDLNIKVQDVNFDLLHMEFRCLDIFYNFLNANYEDGYENAKNKLWSKANLGCVLDKYPVLFGYDLQALYERSQGFFAYNTPEEIKEYIARRSICWIGRTLSQKWKIGLNWIYNFKLSRIDNNKKINYYMFEDSQGHLYEFGFYNEKDTKHVGGLISARVIDSLNDDWGGIYEE